MKHLVPALAALALLTASPALAKPPGHCPPGLAKKNPPCVPPGQAKKGVGVGDRLHYGDYLDRHERRRYDLPRLRRGESYYRVGDRILRVDRETREVLELIEVLAEILN